MKGAGGAGGADAGEGTVLVVDDDDSLRTLLAMRLGAAGLRVLSAARGEEALGWVGREEVDAVLLDLRLAGGEDGLDVMERLAAARPSLPVVILTAHGTVPGAVEAMRRGALGYLSKPAEPDVLLSQVEAAVREGRQHRRGEELRRAATAGDGFMGMIGRSPAMRAMFQQISRVAPADLPVSILGESGTGKELVARAVHALGPRAGRAFLAVNCAALPESLLESELFGHVRGAFTDARSARDGLFKRADGGTLLLDEIGDMSPKVQAALLRVVQEGEITPVGGVRPERVDVRLLAATHRDLGAEVAAGRFREDLFYRVQVLPIRVPPLRERPDDVPLLAMRFLADGAPRLGRGDVRGFTPGALERLRSYPWPGNVRELQACVARGAIMAAGELVDEADVAPPRGAGDPPSPSGEATSTAVLPLSEARAAFERDYLARLLALHRGNVSAVARAAGRYRADVYGMLRQHGLDPDAYREG
ncbi:sigma-54 dependent transcriptional regulator [Myxococcota bacterium]|nr:sigma-54 dependent transcriptional regulator [Myxococcota bacterium]